MNNIRTVTANIIILVTLDYETLRLRLVRQIFGDETSNFICVTFFVIMTKNIQKNRIFITLAVLRRSIVQAAESISAA